MRIISTLLVMTSTFLPAAESLVFVSAFASGEKAGIHAFGFDGKTGSLRPLHRTTDVQNPFFLAVSKDKRFLFAVDAEKFGDKVDENVASFAIPDRSGQLKLINRQSSRGAATCYLDVDATGRTVVNANYSSGSVAALEVDADGKLKPAASFHQHAGSSVDAKRQTGPFAHSIVVSPDNRFALAADLGIDRVLIYQLDAQNPSLTPNPAQTFASLPPGSGPRHLTFHPKRDFVYVINELKNTVTVFVWEPKDGRLTEAQNISTLPADFSGVSYTADVKITPDGRFLFGTNRGHDSIASYRIGDDGKLTLINIQPSGEKGPQNLLVTADGAWLLCANMPGNSVKVFKIDGASGSLTPTGDGAEMPMPSCIQWVGE